MIAVARRVFRNRFVRAFSTGLTVTTAGISVYFLHRNDYSLSSIGAVRFARAGVAVGRIASDYKLSLRGLDPESEEYSTTMKQLHSRGAEKLLALARANGGVFIKVGQHIASLQYILPEEYTKTLSVLHSRAPESKLDEVKRVVEESLNVQSCDELFEFLDQRPKGAASLAQVYEARLVETGERVAVKIQHPKVKPHSLIDIATMEFFVNVVDRLFPEFRLMWLVDEVKRNLPKELDFLNEADNADRVRRMFAHLPYLKIPKIYRKYSSDKVLTMEFCDGVQIDDIKAIEKQKLDKHDICKKIGTLFSEMIFVNGYIHCDPHPGNVLVNKNSEGEVDVVLLDHGLYATLQDDFRINYTKLWLALLKPDRDLIKRYSAKMGVGELYGLFACIVTARSWKAVTNGIDRVSFDDKEQHEIGEYAASLIPQISQVLERVPSSMLLILKTNDLLRSIEHRMGTLNRQDTFLQMSRCCVRSVFEYRLSNTRSWLRRALVTTSMYYQLARIALFEYLLIVAEWIHHAKMLRGIA
uniref:Protein kinase domain-containing protein n=1 Tax=Steinernema glaseri TaxID=37863 RepID=A0A1I8ACY4_9BILA